MTDNPKPTAKADATARSGSVQSVERAMALLEVLGEDEEGYRLTDLATRTGLSLSTVHRLLTTLEKRRFVQFDQSDGMWHVGRTAFSVGSAFVRQRNFVAPALPFLRKLRDQTRETANLGIVDDGEMVVLTQIESREIMRAITRVGGRAPLVASGLGKAILATYSPADVAALVGRNGMPKLTPRSLTRASELRRDLDSIRRQGYSVDDEEFVTGLRCVAAVVYNNQAEALCAISVSGLASRLTSERVAGLGQLLQETARDLTLALGGKMPAQNLP
ncbi:MAG TPA: IclR family transcriptional regulator C-terminal domain-containing protein [Devosia sp.]|nr:IclR family transcriptional regulator C-terminal domain-containing protein [Devosia sp.]